MRVLVAGAAGAIGRRLVPRLVAAGYEVTATTRTAAKAEQLRRLGAEPLVGPCTGGPVKTEDDGLEPHPPRMQRESLAAIRYLEQVVPAAPLEGIVLRYGNFYGPGASESLVELIRKRRVPVIGDGAGVWSWIHLDDDTAAVGQWLPYLAQVVGAKPPLRVPAWLARPMAGAVTVRWMTQSRGSSNQKAKRELNWQPTWPSWREGAGICQ